MKVIYRPRICDQIERAVVLAAASNTEVEAVELTEDEWERFKSETGMRTIGPLKSPLRYMGVEIRRAK